MKTNRIISSIGIACAMVATALCADKIVAGPKGGRLLQGDSFQAEFFVNPERRVEVNFYDAALKPLAPATQVVTVTAEPGSGRVKLDMGKAGTGYVSTKVLPPGEPYRVVVQMRATPEAKPQNFRIDLNLDTCGECKHAEYACTCDGH